MGAAAACRIADLTPREGLLSLALAFYNVGTYLGARGHRPSQYHASSRSAWSAARSHMHSHLLRVFAKVAIRKLDCSPGAVTLRAPCGYGCETRVRPPKLDQTGQSQGAYPRSALRMSCVCSMRTEK